MLCKSARVAPLKLQSSLAKICFNLAELKKFPGRGGWVAGSTENKANSAQLELELGLSLAIS